MAREYAGQRQVGALVSGLRVTEIESSWRCRYALGFWGRYHQDGTITGDPVREWGELVKGNSARWSVRVHNKPRCSSRSEMRSSGRLPICRRSTQLKAAKDVRGDRLPGDFLMPAMQGVTGGTFDERG